MIPSGVISATNIISIHEERWLSITFEVKIIGSTCTLSENFTANRYVNVKFCTLVPRQY